MSTITAIETHYKGYRFRSRLEARWAVFYDCIGVDWTYENDPVNVFDENYLPDFRVHLPTADIIHEVKPENEVHRIRPLKVYLAGKMSPEHDWRGTPSVSLEEGDQPISTDNWTTCIRTFSLDNRIDFWRFGPFASNGNHGAADWPTSIHRMDDESDEWDSVTENIKNSCLSAIQGCDLFCAHINTGDCYATLMELGYAYALRKKISVSIDDHLAQSSRRSMIYPNGAGILQHELGEHDFWFAEKLASHSSMVDGNEGARAFHAQTIYQNTAREYRLISGMRLSGVDITMTFGDPRTVRDGVWIFSSPIHNLCQKNEEAADYARSYRFAG